MIRGKGDEDTDVQYVAMLVGLLVFFNSTLIRYLSINKVFNVVMS